MCAPWHTRHSADTYLRTAFDDSRWKSQPPWTTFLPFLPNLTSYALNPIGQLYVPDELLRTVADALSQCPTLEDVTWNNIINTDALPVVMRVDVPVTLTLSGVYPLASIGPYLKRMPRLSGFRLMEPGNFVAEVIPSLIGNQNLAMLTAFTLRRGHRLSGVDLLTLLGGKANLEILDIYSGRQPADIASSSFSGLPKLRHLTLRTVFGFESPSRSFSTWICAVIASSQLKELRIISWDSTVWTSNSNLTDIVAMQPSLHELAIPECILWCRDFSTIVTGCPVLRHVSFLVTPSFL